MNSMTRKELAEVLVGKTITAVKHTRAYGDMPGEVGRLVLTLDDGERVSSLELEAVGYDPDGIGFVYRDSDGYRQ